MRIYGLLISLLFFFGSKLEAQFVNPPAYTFLANGYEANLNTIDSDIHTSIKPYNSFELKPFYDSLIQSLKIDTDFATNKWIGRKLLNEPFLSISHSDYEIYVNPLFELNYGADDNWPNRNPYTNTRGIQIQGRILKSLHFYTDYHENQLVLPRYLQNFADENDVVFGRGRFKDFKGGPGKDFGFATGMFSFQPNKIFNFQLGHGKHFIGEGYRSLLLSDNAFNYPYLKITANFWKIKYWVLYTRMNDINNFYPDQSFLNKYSTFHFLSVNLTKRLNVGIFETVVYADESGNRGYDANFFNPIIFFRPIEFAAGSRSGNVIFGANLKYKITDKIHAYGQFVLDEFNTSRISQGDGWWGNKFGYQLGIKSFNTIIQGLTLQTELNSVRPYTYTHVTTLNSYSHYNQALAHPLGANFLESITSVGYQRKRYFGELRVVYSKQGLDEGDVNWGGDIFIPNTTREQEFDNEILQGSEVNKTIIDLKVGYIINPSYNLRFEVGVLSRNLDGFIQDGDFQKTNYFFAGLSTRLYNYYSDF